MASNITNTDPITGAERSLELLNLPIDLLTHISKYSITSPKDLVDLSLVCKKINEVVNQDQIWKWLADQMDYKLEKNPTIYKLSFQKKHNDIEITKKYIAKETDPNKKAQMYIDLVKVHPSKEVIETTEALIKTLILPHEQHEKMVEFEFAKPGGKTLDKIAEYLIQSTSFTGLVYYRFMRDPPRLKLIEKYCEIGQLDKALDFFNKSRNSLSYDNEEKIQFLLIDKYCEKNYPYKALVILDQMSNSLDSKYSIDNSLGLKIVDKYFEFEKQDTAKGLLAKINIPSYGNDLDNCFKLLEKYCDKDDLQIVEILLAKLPSDTYERDENLAKFIEKYSRLGKSDIVNILLNNISSSSEKTKCLLVVLKQYINLEKIDNKTEALIDQILENYNWQEDSLLMVIDKYCELKKFNKALYLFAKRSKYSKSSSTLFKLIEKYYSSITPELIKAILDKIPSDDCYKMYSLKALIEECCELGKLDIAEILYNESTDNHVKIASFTIILNKYCEENNLEKVQEYLAKITVDSYWDKISGSETDDKGINILDRACKKKNFDLLKILIQQPLPECEYYKNKPLAFLLDKYSKKGAFDVVKILYDQISSFDRDRTIAKNIKENIESGDIDSLDIAKKLLDLYHPSYIREKIKLQADLINKYIEIGDLDSLDKSIELFSQIPIENSSFCGGEKAKLQFKLLVKYLNVITKKDLLDKAGNLLAQIPSDLYFYGDSFDDNEYSLFNKLKKLGNDENSQYIVEALLPKISQSYVKKCLIINLMNQYCEKNLNEKAEALIPQLNKRIILNSFQRSHLPDLSNKAKSLLPSHNFVAERCNIT